MKVSKEDAFKSLCQGCFVEKSQFFLSCRCLFCKNCIQAWTEKSQQNQQTGLLVCCKCLKETDGKINNFQDAKAAQQFAFLFAEPETLFERQIDIIKVLFYSFLYDYLAERATDLFSKQFQRKQSKNYIEFLQNQVQSKQDELSSIYSAFPEIKNAIQNTNGAALFRQKQTSNSCLNFKSSSDFETVGSVHGSIVTSRNQKEALCLEQTIPKNSHCSPWPQQQQISSFEQKQLIQQQYPQPSQIVTEKKVPLQQINNMCSIKNVVPIQVAIKSGYVTPQPSSNYSRFSMNGPGKTQQNSKRNTTESPLILDQNSDSHIGSGAQSNKYNLNSDGLRFSLQQQQQLQYQQQQPQQQPQQFCQTPQHFVSSPYDKQNNLFQKRNSLKR